jgi:hypothetical protein
VARQLEKHRKSIVAAAGALMTEGPRGAAAAAEIPAPTVDAKHSDRAWEGGAPSLNIVVPMISGQKREDAV